MVLELLVVLAAIGVGGIGAGPHIGAASICRGAAPAWVCDSFGYADRAAVSVVTPAPSAHYIGESFGAPRPSRSDHTPSQGETADATPSPTLIAKEPGKRSKSRVAHTYRGG